MQGEDSKMKRERIINFGSSLQGAPLSQYRPGKGAGSSLPQHVHLEFHQPLSLTSPTDQDISASERPGAECQSTLICALPRTSP